MTNPGCKTHLDPCPYCGAHPCLYAERNLWSVGCPNCGFEHLLYNTPVQAWLAWNAHARNIGWIVKSEKGGRYSVAGEVAHTETGELPVIYNDLATNATFARPLNDFCYEADKVKKQGFRKIQLTLLPLGD